MPDSTQTAAAQGQAQLPVKKPKQPASKIYAFDRGWRVQKYVWMHLFQRTTVSAGAWFTGRKNGFIKGAKYWFKESKSWRWFRFWAWCIGAGVGLGGASQYVSALIVAVAFAGLLTATLSVWAAISLIFIGLLTAGNYIYSSFYRLAYRCPVCFDTMTIPVFICSNPVCGARHTKLWPSWYGVFHHRCNNPCGPKNEPCGTRLPTLNLLGRKQLVRLCPHCDTPLNSTIGAVPPVHVAVAGGRSTGKTYFLVTATRELIQRYAVERSYQITFPSEDDRRNYEANLDRLTPGRQLDQTNVRPNAYNLDIQAPHSALAKKLLPRASLSRLAYVYDVMGESFASSANMTVQSFYSYINSLIFVIDPFSIPEFYARHKSEIDSLRAALRPSPLDVEEAYRRMTELLEASIKLKPGDRTERPLAVIVTKVDALGLEDVIGAPAAQRLMANDPTICLEEDAISLLVRNFLEEYGQGNLVRSLESQFNNIKYFSCSALGGLLGSTSNGHTPIRIVEPLVWALGFSRSVPTISERIALADAQHRAQGKATGNPFRSLRYYYWNSLKPRRLERSA